MSACAAATGPVRAPGENSAFPTGIRLSPPTFECHKLERTREIKRVLKRVGFTVCRASALTAIRYGERSPYYVPPTFLYKIRNGITPHVCQLVALSQITGYSFSDWMNLCGFDLGLILPLQLEVHHERTALITPAAHTFQRHDLSFVFGSLKIERTDRYLFVKIGSADNVVYPKLLSGSVVRADRRYSPQIRSCEGAEKLLWLVEHPGGLACCHVHRIDDEHIVLFPSRSPLSAWPLRLSREARVLGLIDLELRPRGPQQFESRYHPIKTDTLATIPRGIHAVSLSTLLRSSRARAGLTLRDAHQKTNRIAQLLQNPDYRIPLGLLSDYEAIDRFPRHIAKIISLCVVYGIDFWQLMQAGGSEIDDCRKSTLFSTNARMPPSFAVASQRENVKHG